MAEDIEPISVLALKEEGGDGGIVSTIIVVSVPFVDTVSRMSRDCFNVNLLDPSTRSIVAVQVPALSTIAVAISASFDICTTAQGRPYQDNVFEVVEEFEGTVISITPTQLTFESIGVLGIIVLNEDTPAYHHGINSTPLKLCRDQPMNNVWSLLSVISLI